MTGENPLLVILGPTASGKSALALEIARKTHAQILSVDSMQVYRGMDIGTAKASLAERSQITHHLLDRVRPDEVFSAARFVELAQSAIASVGTEGGKLILTGGTPLFFKALFDGLFAGPPADDSIRQRLGDLQGRELHDRLVQVDPSAAARIHPTDRKRLIRALEVHELTGQPISSLQSQWGSGAAERYPAVWIGLLWEREALNSRINARVKQMIAVGWVDEVRQLLGQYPQLSKTAQEATGYRELIEHIQGRRSLEDAIEQIKIATRQLARRQMKWFRRFRQVHWLPGDRPLEQNVEQTLRLWPG
jgi:tRNA dimethylallyltransferase